MIWDASPILIELGPIQIRWYGLLFATAFLVGYQLMRGVFIKEKRPLGDLENLLVYLMVGTVVGARLAHCLFYEPNYYLSQPLEILKVWRGGLASHGGALGILFATYLYSQKRPEQPFAWLLSRIALTVPLAGFFIRIGNFFNSEILGTPSNLPWAIVFSRIDFVPRHPAQLYEAFSYLLIFFIMYRVYKRQLVNTSAKLLLGLLFSLIFLARFIIEFVKEGQSDFEPQAWLNVGQLLSIPFILAGLYLLYLHRKTLMNGDIQRRSD